MRKIVSDIWGRVTRKPLSLRNQIYLVLSGLVLITFMSCLVIVWHNYRIEKLLYSIMDEDLVAYQIAENLEVALVSQKGFVSYYFLDGDPNWLRMLGEHRQIFKEKLKEANQISQTSEEKAVLAEIDRSYWKYLDLKDQVIHHYKTDKRDRGTELHKIVRKMFFDILKDCKRYKELNASKMKKASLNSHVEASRLRIIAGVLVVSISLLSLSLVLVLTKRILDPLNRMTLESSQASSDSLPMDEVTTLDRNIKGLLLDVGQKSTKLEESRQHLKQSEKMAMVGKLAAGMAHSIRNPLTSVKMRLFSLGRTARLTKNQKEDFQVISEEIHHVDTIVQNFLEFSRPPKLNFQRVSPSVVVDLALQLLEHRLKSYNVEVTVVREQPLPDINGDPEQLKEVVVNIIINACEAMDGRGGTVLIEEEDRTIEGGKRVLTLKISDDGPGIPNAIKEKIFEPFFTTKDEGTGLGLSIATRIIEGHNGYLECVSEVGKGSLFTINFVKNENLE
ncbi:histidine kinase [bacterium]|nr:histidine kinase [bacterium]